MYDFDKLFEEHILKKGHVCEDELSELYDEWYVAYCEKLGASPRDKINSLSDAELVAELVDECRSGSPSYAVMENLERRAPVQLLVDLLDSENTVTVYCAAELLRNIEKPPLSKFVNMLDTDDEDLFELLVSVLKQSPDEVKDSLLEQAKTADVRKKTAIADILSGAGRDERIFALLSELFSLGDNIPLYASYLSKYGDERAAAQLYRALDTAGYADYIEIRNAIEALGGVVDDYRDFSSDPEYIALKEKKNGK